MSLSTSVSRKSRPENRYVGRSWSISSWWRIVDEDQRHDALGFLQAVVVQRGEDFGFSLEPRQPIRIGGEGVGQIG